MRDLIVMIGFLGLLPLCFLRPAVGVLVWTWFAIMNPHRQAYGFAQTFGFNLYITVIVAAGLLVSSDRKTPLLTGGIALMFAWFGWTWLTTRYAIDPANSLEFFHRIPLKVYIFVLFLTILIDRSERVIAAIWMFCICIGYYGARNGIVGILKGGGNLGRAEDFGPIATMIQDRNHLGLVMVMTLPLLHFLAKHVEEKFVRLTLRFVLFFTFVAIFVSYSRGAFVALLCMGVYYWFGIKNKFVYLLAALVIGVGAYTVMPPEFKERMNIAEKIQTDESFQGRVHSWNFAKLIADMRPYVGGGFRINESVIAVEQYGEAVGHTEPLAAHSIYFQVLGEHGYVGLSLFVGTLVAAYFATMRIRRRTKNAPGQEWAYDLAGALQAGQFAFLLGGAALSLAYFDGLYLLLTVIFVLDYLTAKRCAELKTTPKTLMKTSGWADAG